MTESDFLTSMVAAARVRAAAERLGQPPAARAHRFADALRRRGTDGLALIAEVKRASPSKGAIAPALDAVAQARAYTRAGAEALSVLTEPSHFAGSLDDLAAVAAATDLPILRKDFIVDPCQVRLSAELGAAAVLLIVAALSDDELRRLLEECTSCELDALVEVHSESELTRALKAGAHLVGVNNRDLHTLAVDLATTEALAPLVPGDLVLVSESGIRTSADAYRLAAAGVDALLVGETLITTAHDRLPQVVRQLQHVPHHERSTPEPPAAAQGNQEDRP